MGIRGIPLGLLALLGSSSIVALIVFTLYAVSGGTTAMLTAWALGSIPLGILIGHCVRGGD